MENAEESIHRGKGTTSDASPWFDAVRMTDNISSESVSLNWGVEHSALEYRYRVIHKIPRVINPRSLDSYSHRTGFPLEISPLFDSAEDQGKG